MPDVPDQNPAELRRTNRPRTQQAVKLRTWKKIIECWIDTENKSEVSHKHWCSPQLPYAPYEPVRNALRLFWYQVQPLHRHLVLVPFHFYKAVSYRIINAIATAFIITVATGFRQLWHHCSIALQVEGYARIQTTRYTTAAVAVVEEASSPFASVAKPQRTITTAQRATSHSQSHLLSSRDDMSLHLGGRQNGYASSQHLRSFQEVLKEEQR